MKRDVCELEYFRGVEVQVRGALHDHAMVWSPVPLSLARLRALAIAAGFGHEVDLAECEPGSTKAAYYVSKYVTKATDSREAVPWMGDVIDYETGEVTRGLVPGRYRTWSMSRGWGDTMGEIRRVAAVYARMKAGNADALLLRDALRALRAVGLVPDDESEAEPPPGAGT